MSVKSGCLHVVYNMVVNLSQSLVFTLHIIYDGDWSQIGVRLQGGDPGVPTTASPSTPTRSLWTSGKPMANPVLVNRTEIEHVSNFKYLGVHISEDLTWTLNTSNPGQEGSPLSQEVSSDSGELLPQHQQFWV